MVKSKQGSSLPSSTRLSPSAKPFELNRSNRQPSSNFAVKSGQQTSAQSLGYCSSDPFASLLDSFPEFSLSTSKNDPAFSAPMGDLGFGHDVAATSAFPVEIAAHTLESFNSQHPLMDFQESADFDVVSGSGFDLDSITGLGYSTSNVNEQSYGKQGTDYHETLLGKGNNCGTSSSGGGMLQKDMCAAVKLKTSSQNQCCYTPSIVTPRKFVSSGGSDGQYFSKVPSIANAVSDSMKNHPVILHESSSACLAPLSYDSSRNVDCLTGSFVANNDKNCPSHSISGAKGSFVNADRKGIEGGKSSINEWQKKKSGKSVSNDGANYSLTTNCKLGVCLTNIPNEVIEESRATRAGLSIDTSSKTLGDSDSDVDSPCWKGTMTSIQSPPEVSGSVHSQSMEKEFQKSNSLNPLAPQFFPSNAEKSKYLGNGNVKDDFVSSKPSVTLAVNLLSGEDRCMKDVEGDEHLLELKRGFELQHNINIYKGEKEFNLHSDKKMVSLPNSPGVTESCNIENPSTLIGRPVNTVNVEGFVMGTEYVRTSQSRSGSFPAKGCPSTPSLSSSQVGVVTDLSKKLEDGFKSLIESPKIDVQTMVNAMHDLSELIVQTCAHGLYSYNEHDIDTIQKIVHNLNVFSTDYCGQRVPTCESTHTGNSYYLDKSSELAKEFGETSIETLAVAHRLNQNYSKGHNRNYNMGQSSVARVVADNGWYPFSLSNDVNTEKVNEIVQHQIIRRSLGNRLQLEEQMHPDSQLFWNLWLNSEAERCFEKYKTHRQFMESGMDVNCKNIWT